MNVSLKNNDAVSGILKVEIEKSDYAELLDKNLHKLRRKVDMPGFRKGMVPLSIVKKLYGKHAMAEEINKLVMEKLSSYIFDHDLKILGEPIPHGTEQKTIDYDTDENFEFYFDVAFSPDIAVELTKTDTLNYYQVRIDDAMIDKQVESYLKYFGSYDTADNVEAEDMVKGIVAELEDGQPKAGGILIEDVVLMPLYMKDKTEQEKFIGASPDHTIVFNPYNAYEGAESEIASFLQIDREKVKDTKGDFTFKIKEITRHKPAELNQELFDRIFGSDVVKDEAVFRDKIKEFLTEQFVPDSDYVFRMDMRAMLLKKAGEVTFAEEILKRWLLLVDNDKPTREKVDEDYPKVAEDLTYHLIKEKLARDHEIKVGKEDLEACGKRMVQAQFAQYGMLSVPDDVLANYVKDLLKKQDTVKNLVNVVIDEKLSVWIKEQITVTVQEVTVEELSEISKELKNKNSYE
ncbi:MAG: trigger factor [Tannerella sp.]|jgi:trigger factor|nr:trigger factor [Tannerella sp.]